jgi:hypothetical protein
MHYSISKDRFHLLLADDKLTRLEKLLLVLFWEDEAPKSAKKVIEIAVTNGLKEAKKWNVSDILGRSSGKATSIKEGWIITISGRSFLKEKDYLSDKASIIKNDISDLRSHLSKIKNADTLSFINESISCLEANQNRAAVVYSWIGAVSLLYDHVVNNHLTSFNTEALKRDAKWKTAKNADDLSRMKEYDFLNVLESISIIGKNVKQELQQCLQLRNSCGHPNSLKFGLRRVASHIEILILNVFGKF